MRKLLEMIKDELIMISERWQSIGIATLASLQSNNLPLFKALSDTLIIEDINCRKRLDLIKPQAFNESIDLYLEAISLEALMDRVLEKINNIKKEIK